MHINYSFEPKDIDYKISKDRLTNYGGLKTLLKAFNDSVLKDPFEQALPVRKSPRSGGAYRLGLVQVASFLYGHDCLADLEKFRKDPFLTEIMQGESVAPRTMGDFLRDFKDENLLALNTFLTTQARAYRDQLHKMQKKSYKPSLAPHLFIDSTPHVQSGTKIEGVAWNYKDQWCLDSQLIFDELGFCWDMELRPGNTKSGVGASEQIKRAFRNYKSKDEKYLSADSAYCNQETMKTLVALGVKFTLTAHGATTGWESHIGEIPNWKPWVYSQEEKEWAQETGRDLPEVEVGSFHWRPSWNETLCFPIVVKRTPTDQVDLFNGGYRHYAVVTNHSLFQQSTQQIIEHHNKRGNAENFIREGKYGYDLKHFPCLKMRANHAFGLLGFVAHNILRWVSHHENPKKPPYAKYLREKFLHIPGKLVSHAGYLALRIPKHFYEEVQKLSLALQFKPCPALDSG
jgi:hypothetical protein